MTAGGDDTFGGKLCRVQIIRRAGTGDLEPLLEIIREFNTVDGHQHDGIRIREALGPLLVDDTHGQIWMIGDDAGYAVVTWGYRLESGGREALLDEFYVRVPGTGTGSRALAEILAAATAAGAQRMILETAEHNERARRFYRRRGFTAEDSIWMSRDLATSPLG